MLLAVLEAAVAAQKHARWQNARTGPDWEESRSALHALRQHQPRPINRLRCSRARLSPKSGSNCESQV